MKIIITILSFFVCANVFGQTFGFPAVLPGNSKPQITVNQGSVGTTTGFTFLGNFGDTTDANVPSYIRFQPGIMIVTGTSTSQSLWIRNSTASAWLSVGGGGSVSARNGLTVNSGFVEIGGIMTKSDTIYTGASSNFPFVWSSLSGSPISTLTIDFNSAGGGNEGIVKLDARGFAGTGFSYLGSDPGNVKYFVNNFNTPALSASSGISYGNTLSGYQAKLNNANIISQFVLGAGQNFFCDSCLMIRATGAGMDLAADGVGGGRIGFRGSASNNTSWYGAFLGGTNSHFVLGSTLTDIGNKKFIVYGSSYHSDSLFLWTPVGTTADSVLVKSGGFVRAVAQSSVTGVNIYNSDGTLTANRRLDGNNFTLTFSGLGGFKADLNPVFQIASTATTGTTTSASFSVASNSLTTGTSIYEESNSLSSGKMIDIAVTGTAALTGQTGINVSLSGANSSASQVTYGGYFSNTHTGTTPVNWSAYFKERINVGDGTNDANHVIVVKSLDNTASHGIKILANNETSFMQIGYQTIATNGGMILSTSATGVQVSNAVYIGGAVTPTAKLHIAAGTTSASSAPIKLTTGTSMTSAEAGAIEYTTDDLFFTIATGTARKRFIFADATAGLTSGRVPYVTTNGRLLDAAGMTFDGTSILSLGVSNTTAGKVKLFGGTSGDATITTPLVAGAGTTITLPGATGTLATLAGTETFTNKRWTARVGSTTSSATPTINTDNTDIYKLTAQTVDITSFTTNLSGTPVDGDVLEIQVTGTAARAITWGTSFVASTVALPTTTVTTATLSVVFQYYTTSSYGNNKWVCVNSY